uniref:FAM124 domain-containing protein n=1 Tax=Periophthalmus magnuspinnatus TaxID=409849 RepID=A0A3B4B4Q7_9GOBI
LLSITEDIEHDCAAGRGNSSPSSSLFSLFSVNGADLMADLQDPYLVSVHLIADPDQGSFLQHATDAALSWIHRDLQLFRVSERAHRSKKRPQNPSSQPALAVILFLQESYGGEEHILSLHRALQRPPWRYHHTEKVSNGKRMLPLTPSSQDFFTLTPGTPLWAVRQVHYGKEIVRFTIYCRYENYIDMVRLYKLLLQKRVAQKKEDFCFFVVYSNADLEIQLSFKRLQKGQAPLVLDSALLEVRVRDVGALVPLLPHTCRPISELRWETQDYDGNKILDRYIRLHLFELKDTLCIFSCLQTSQMSLPLAYDYLNPNDDWSEHRYMDQYVEELKNNHSGSLFSLPNITSTHSLDLSRNQHRQNLQKSTTYSLVPPFRLNVDALIGAEETDVDTGDKVAMDLSVVSAYIQAGLNLNSRPVSAPPEEIVPSRSPSIPDVNVSYKAATIGGRSGVNRSNSLIVNGHCSSSSSIGALLGQAGLDISTTPSVSSVSINHSDNCSIEEEKIEEEEFYI